MDPLQALRASWKAKIKAERAAYEACMVEARAGGVSTRTMHAIRREMTDRGLDNMDPVAIRAFVLAASDDDLLRIRNFGQTSLAEVRGWLGDDPRWCANWVGEGVPD